MVTISQRRRHPRWRMLFTVVILSSFVRRCELTSTKRLTDAGSSSSSSTLSTSSGETRSQNLGSPNDLAWQAWLLLDSQTGAHSGMDSATLLRRITPKSVFIAPALPALPPCPDGYRADTMGRCVKNVNIDQEAHFVFLLHQLNSQYSNRESSESFNSNSKKSNGPLQLNIPLFPSSNSEPSKLEPEETRDTIKVPVVVHSPIDTTSNEEKPPSEVVVANHAAKNTTKPKDNQFGFLPADSTVSSSEKQEAPTRFDAVVPVAEFPVDDANETFPEVVDYKIPIDLNTLLNISNLKRINITDDQVPWKNGSQLLNSTEATPMLILLPSTATSPNLVVPNAEDLTLESNGSHQTHVRESNVTKNVTDREIISEIVPEPTLPNRDLDVPPAVVDRIDANKTQDGNSSDTRNAANVQESQETEPYYDDEEEAVEDYADSTDLPDEESSETEGGEILKHGEAGMAILLKGIKRLQNEHRQQADTAASDAKNSETPTTELSSDSWTRANESTTTDKEERDEVGSNVSSEVSINGDMIVETTLLDVTTDKTRNITRTPDNSNGNTTSSIEDGDEYLRELFESEKETNPEPSSENVQSTEKPQTDQHRSVEDPKSDELEAAPSSSESLLYDPSFRDRYAEEDPITEIHTIDEQPTDDKEAAAFLKKSRVPNSFRTFVPETVNLRPTQDDRHPTYPKQSNPVKFPSEEVNSIHSQDYKDRAPYPLDDGLRSSTKSSLFAHQKPFHRGLSSWRTVSRGQQVSSQQAGTSSRRQWQRQPPISISFWTAMPLMRDPSLYSTDQDSHSKTTNGQTYTNNRFPEVSPS